MKNKTPTSVDLVTAHFGSKAKVARALNLTRGSITHWGVKVPEIYTYKLQYITKGKLKVSELLKC